MRRSCVGVDLGASRTEKTSKTISKSWFRTFWGSRFWMTCLDLESFKSVPIMRGARFPFRRSAPIMRGARFSTFGVSMGCPRWVQRWRQKRYRNNGFWMNFKIEGLRRAVSEEHNLQNTLENQYLAPSPWDLLRVHWGWPIFACAPLGCSSGALR